MSSNEYCIVLMTLSVTYQCHMKVLWCCDSEDANSCFERFVV